MHWWYIKQPCHDYCYLYCEVLFCSLLSGSMIPSKQYIIQRLSLKLRWHLQGCTFPKRKFMLQPPTSGDQYCYTVLSGWSICRSQDFRGAPIVDDWWHRWCVQLWMITCKTLDADIPFYNSYWKFIGVCHLYPAIYLKKPRKSCTCRGISDMFRTILNDLIADIYIYILYDVYIAWRGQWHCHP